MLDKPMQNERSTNMFENKLQSIVTQSENKRCQNIFKNTDASEIPYTEQQQSLSLWTAENG